MKRHYDIGIVGCWYWGNYGSLLNGYATFRILKEMGLQPLNIVTPNNGFEPHAKKLFQVIYNDDDISEFLPFERLGEYNSICDKFINGSDQIWHYNPDRRYENYFKLDFVADDKTKISFSTSFGQYISEPPNIRKNSEKLLKRYSAISVRESQGVEILAQAYGIEATQVLEPVFDIEKDVWDELASHSACKEQTPYLLTYILDPTPEKRRAIEFYANKLGIKAINILEGFSAQYSERKKALDLPNTMPIISAYDFLKYYQNAKFVITDSFHGICFSIIYNKPFICIDNTNRGSERFNSLLSKINMRDRMVQNETIPLDERFLWHLDFNEANKYIEKERQRAVDWLRDAVKLGFNDRVSTVKRHVNVYLDKKKCMGCGACVSVCPTRAIKLVPDEHGVYRAVVDAEKCLDCQECKAVCAALELPRNLNSSNPISYAFVDADREELMRCASGGAGTVFAKTVLNKGGVVIGAAWKDDFSVEHIIVDSKNDLYKLQKSKYFQSYTGDICKKVREILNMGTLVMFIGTPCQVAGLKKYLGKNYSNLLAVDLLCANCPSAGLFKKYLDEKYNINNIDSYNFRYKSDSDVWHAKSSNIIRKDGSMEIIKYVDDDYLQVYHACSFSLASQCLSCQYQGTMRVGDLTIGDCWGIECYDKEISDYSGGVSVILVNNAKGQDFLGTLPDEYIGVLKEEPLEMVKKYNIIAFIENRNWSNTVRRKVFHETILQESYHEAKKKAMEISNE